MKQETKNTNVIKAETQAMVLPKDLQGSWGAENLDTSDILIPKLLIMQGLSEFVAKKKAQLGDIVKSTTGQIVGGESAPVGFIPLMSFKTWVKMEKVKNKFEYRGTEAMTPLNMDAETEWTENGTQWIRNRCLNFYVLLPKDIENEIKAMKSVTDGELPDPEACVFPCLLTFTRTGYKAGKELISHFAKAMKFGVPPAISIFNLSTTSMTNDLGTFYVPTVTRWGKTSLEHLQVAKKWYDIVSKTNVKVDDKAGFETTETEDSDTGEAQF